MAKKIVIGVLVALVLIAGIAFWYVNYIFIPQKLKPMLIDALEKSLDKKVAIAQAQYFPFKGVTLSGIDIRERDGTPFAAVRNIDVRLNKFPQLNPNDIRASGLLVIQEFSFNQETLAVSANARISLDARIKGKEKPVFTAALTLENSAVRGIPSAPDILNISGTINVTESAFKTADLGAMIQNLPLRIGAAGTYTPQDLMLEKLEISYADRTNLSAQGAIRNMEAPSADLTFLANVELAEVNTLLSAQKLPPMKGTVALQGAVKGPLDDPATLNAKVTVGAPLVHVDKLRLSELNAAANLSKGTLICEPCTFRFYEGAGKVSAKAQIADATLPLNAVADLEGVNLLPLILDMTGQDVGGGKVSAHVAVKGPAINQFALTGDGWFKMTEGKVQIPSRLDRLAATLQIKQLEYMVINDASATFTIREAKVDTRDAAVNADIGTMTAAGYVGFDQSVDVEVLVRLGTAALEAAGGIANLGQFVSDRNGLPVTKIKVYGRMPDALKHRIIPMPVEDILKSAVPQVLESVIKGDENSPAGKQGLEDTIDALKGIFQKN